MGVLGDLFDAAVDKGSDLLSDGAGGLFGGDDDGGGLLDQALGAISGGDGGGGGLLGGLLGDSGGGALGGLLGDSGGGALGGLLGDSGGGALGGLLGEAESFVDDVTSAVGGGSWSDSVGGIVDRWAGGDGGGLLGGDALSGITSKVAEFVPSEVTDAAESILGSEGSWAGSLLGEVSDHIPDEWTSVTDTVLGSGLGEGGFDDWVDRGMDALGSLGVPDDVLTWGKGAVEGLEPDELLDLGRHTLDETGLGQVAGLGDQLTSPEVPGNTGIVPPHLQDAEGVDAPGIEDIDGGDGDGDIVASSPDIEHPVGAELDLGGAGDPIDPVGAEPPSDPGLDDVAAPPEAPPDEPAIPAEPAPAPEPTPVEAPADEFDQAISAADEIESSTDELFEGLE